MRIGLTTDGYERVSGDIRERCQVARVCLWPGNDAPVVRNLRFSRDQVLRRSSFGGQRSIQLSYGCVGFI
jgi:hypothetical protein